MTDPTDPTTTTESTIDNIVKGVKDLAVIEDCQDLEVNRDAQLEEEVSKDGIAKDVTTRTLVGKTRLADKSTLKLDIDQCLAVFALYINNSKTENGILQLRVGFKNSFTCDMYLKDLDQSVSMKICKNGSFQFTGCITINCAYLAIKYAISIIKKIVVSFEHYEILIYEVMSNYRLDLKRKIKQSLLINFFQSHVLEYPNYKCFKSTSCSALNCKYLVSEEDILERQVVIFNENDLVKTVPYNQVTDDIICHEIKDYYVTFLIFESGKVIVSGINESVIEKVSTEFLRILNKFFDHYEVGVQCNPVEKKTIKRQSYDRIVLVKIDENDLYKQYIVIRGKSTYISSRTNKLMVKHPNCKTVYSETCNNVNVFKKLKWFLKHEQGVTFNNVIISIYNNTDEDMLIRLLTTCNVE